MRIDTPNFEILKDQKLLTVDKVLGTSHLISHDLVLNATVLIAEYGKKLVLLLVNWIFLCVFFFHNLHKA